MFYSVSLFSQAPLACGSCALPSVLSIYVMAMGGSHSTCSPYYVHSSCIKNPLQEKKIDLGEGEQSLRRKSNGNKVRKGKKGTAF